MRSCAWSTIRKKLKFDALLRVFWESHDPTQGNRQGNRQGNDIGAQYRSGVYVTTPAQRAAADRSKVAYGKALVAAGSMRPITTEVTETLDNDVVEITFGIKPAFCDAHLAAHDRRA